MNRFRDAAHIAAAVLAKSAGLFFAPPLRARTATLASRAHARYRTDMYDADRFVRLMSLEQCRAMRERLNWTRPDLARVSGVPLWCVEAFENGEEISVNLTGSRMVKDQSDLRGDRSRGIGIRARLSLRRRF